MIKQCPSCKKPTKRRLVLEVFPSSSTSYYYTEKDEKVCEALDSPGYTILSCVECGTEFGMKEE